MINRIGAKNRAVRSSATSSALYQGLPAAISQVVSATGVMNEAWYRFFQMIWLKNSSGISNDVTLASVADAAETAQLTADGAQSDATNALNEIQAETNRAVNAEANLQNNINAVNNRFGAVNNFGNTTGSAGAQAGWVQVTINGTAYVMPVYNT